jgi:arabinofuranosyltransferase
LSLNPGASLRSMAMTRRVLLLLFAYGAMAWLLGVGLVDDSYIFLRYGRNVSMGFGPVFNIGERVEGYSSPLWLALVSGLFALKSEPSALLGPLSAMLGFVAIILIARRSFLGALAVALNPAFVYWSFSGMDAALTALCLTITALALSSQDWTSRRLAGGGVAFALACLSRQENLSLLPVVGIWIFWRSKKEGLAPVPALTSFALPLVIVGAHLAWRWSYYGAMVANTATAKVGVGRDALLVQGLAFLPAMLLTLVPVIVIVWLTARPFMLLACGLSAFWIALVVAGGGDHFPFVRFAVPLLAMLAALCGGSPQREALTRAVVAMLVIQSAVLTMAYRTRGSGEVALAVAWAETGRQLNRTLPVDATLATLVAGAIPYFADRPAVDLLGLTDAHIARQGHIAREAIVGHQRMDSDYVLMKRPTVIVLHDSGRYAPARFQDPQWPGYSGNELGYVAALEDLIERDETKRLYAYRADLMTNGRYLEALWRR